VRQKPLRRVTRQASIDLRGANAPIVAAAIGAGISKNSGDPEDKLLACLNHGVNIGGAAYMKDPNYFDACARWHAELTPLQRDTVRIVQDCYAGPTGMRRRILRLACRARRSARNKSASGAIQLKS
jgi:hypothetical protein